MKIQLLAADGTPVGEYSPIGNSTPLALFRGKVTYVYQSEGVLREGIRLFDKFGMRRP